LCGRDSREETNESSDQDKLHSRYTNFTHVTILPDTQWEMIKITQKNC